MFGAHPKTIVTFGNNAKNYEPRSSKCVHLSWVLTLFSNFQTI